MMRGFFGLRSAAMALALACHAASPHKDPAQRFPIEFRCDAGKALSQPNEWLCEGNVVVRRPDMVLCCDRFQGFADERSQWQKFTCEGDVRAQRHDELMWSNRAIFDIATDAITLEGKPLLRRGKSLMRGAYMVIYVEEDRARVFKPQGVIGDTEDLDMSLEVPDMHPPGTPLPQKCPIPASPRH